MTYQSSTLSLENVAVDSPSSTSLPEVRQDDNGQAPNYQVNEHPFAVQNEQDSTPSTLPRNINTAFQTLQNHINGLHSLSESEAEKGLDTIRHLALNLYQIIPATGDHHANSDPHYESTTETSPEHFTVFNDIETDDSGSEDSYTLVDPSHDTITHSYSRESDNKENKTFDDATLPDWACTVTAGGCRVPLFWEGGDMGYFEYNQEQSKGGKGIC